MRVVSGDLRGRRIGEPLSQTTRPTTDKVREAVFNALGSLDVIEGARVMDLYAGTGAMGIEALSRGASQCVFVENDRAALEVLRENIKALGLLDRSVVIAADALVAVGTHGQFDLLVADPPYGFGDWERILGKTSANIVVVESDRALDPIDGWALTRSKRYGRTHISFLTRGDVGQDTVETT